MSGIKFGTDGWRAVMAETFTFENVRMVAQSIADYINNHQLGPRGVVIGFDTRFLSDQFARTVAEVMLGNGIPVFLTDTYCPTPVTAYITTSRQAAGAVMLTASHNPPEYNGIKFIPEYGGPALPEVTDEVEQNLSALMQLPEERAASCAPPYRCLSLEEGRRRGIVQEIDPREEYLAHLSRIINVEAIRRRPLKVVVDPMYGCGMGYLEEFLARANCQVKTIHAFCDPRFGGIVPEPMGRWLSELREAVVSSRADLGLALDGDADRFGVIDRNGQYFTANESLYLFLHHLLHTREHRGPVARTVATTHMLDRIAIRYGLSVEETAVGFKYIGQSLRERGAIIGGEESGGLSIHGHVPEKDGILGCALMVEMVSVWGKDPAELKQEILAEYGSLVSERLDLHTTPEEKDRIMGILKEFNPAVIAGYRVLGSNRVDGLKLVLERDSWILIRPSGTEPLFRLYVETTDSQELKKIQEAVREMLKI